MAPPPLGVQLGATLLGRSRRPAAPGPRRPGRPPRLLEVGLGRHVQHVQIEHALGAGGPRARWCPAPARPARRSGSDRGRTGCAARTRIDRVDAARAERGTPARPPRRWSGTRSPSSRSDQPEQCRAGGTGRANSIGGSGKTSVTSRPSSSPDEHDDQRTGRPRTAPRPPRARRSRGHGSRAARRRPGPSALIGSPSGRTALHVRPAAEHVGGGAFGVAVQRAGDEGDRRARPAPGTPAVTTIPRGSTIRRRRTDQRIRRRAPRSPAPPARRPGSRPWPWRTG